MSNSLDQRSFDQDNEFLGKPQTQRSRLEDKSFRSSEIQRKYLPELEQRNRRLKNQIANINAELALHSGKLKNKKEPYRLIPLNSRPEVMEKQLLNARKQINMYKHDIQILEEKQSKGPIFERMSCLENALKQKEVTIEKLKMELALLSKKTVDYSRKLKDNTGKEQFQTAIIKESQEIEVLREKIREAEQRQKKKEENAKKQLEFIKQIQKKLADKGVAASDLDEIKKHNLLNNIFQLTTNKASNDRKRNSSLIEIPKQQKELKGGQIQQLTIDRYQMLKNDILTYRKLQQDYQKKYDQLIQQKQAEKKAKIQAKEKLIQKQKELETLENELNQLRLKVKKIKLKPKHLIVRKEEEKPKRKLNYGRAKHKAQEIDMEFNSSIKHDQKGVKSYKGQRFSDRQIIGKNYNCKITAVKVWTDKTNLNICGIQCTYKMDQMIQPGDQHVNKAGMEFYTESTFEMADGDYLKSVSGSLGSTNLIEYLVFISNNSKIARYGVVKPIQKQFNFNIQDFELPVCMYGSLTIKAEPGKPDISLLEQLGFVIMPEGKNEKPQA